MQIAVEDAERTADQTTRPATEHPFASSLPPGTEAYAETETCETPGCARRDTLVPVREDGRVAVLCRVCRKHLLGVSS